jgi:NAD(P)-dependent dehydrogenase (short-subunit alcohol dehydrogenase family)
VAEFGKLDAAFNNAGVMARIASIANSTREEWDRVIGINLRGVWSCMNHELRQMVRQGSCAVVKLVVAVDYAEWTPANHLRHAKFVGLRQDKNARSVVRET